MFRLPTDVFSRPSTLGRRSAFWVLFVIGLTLTATLLLDVYADWIHQGDPLWSTVLENSVPIFLALTLPYIGWGLLQNSPGPFYLPEAAKYALVGGAGLALFSGLVVGAQLLQEQIKPAVIVLQLTTIGALAGLYTGYNVAQLRETKQEAQEDRDRLANLLEGLPAPVVHGTFDGDELTVLKANAAFEEVFGVSVEKVVGKNLYDFVVPEEKQEEAADIDRQAIDQGFVDREVQRRTTEGLRDFQLRVAQALDDGASETYAIYTDITEQKERERDLRLFKKAVEQANDAVLVTEAHPIDEPGPKIEYVNPALEEMTGYPREELEGNSPRVLQGPETDRETLDRVREALESGESWSGETINYRKDGEPYHLRWSLAPVRDDEGKIEHWMSVQRDITEEREPLPPRRTIGGSVAYRWRT